MIVIMITDSLLSCGDCCGGGNCATAKRGCLAKIVLDLLRNGMKSKIRAKFNCSNAFWRRLKKLKKIKFLKNVMKLPFKSSKRNLKKK